MEGLNKLFESLFDVTLEPAGTRFGELWSPEVIKLVSFTGLACFYVSIICLNLCLM